METAFILKDMRHSIPQKQQLNAPSHNFTESKIRTSLQHVGTPMSLIDMQQRALRVVPYPMMFVRPPSIISSGQTVTQTPPLEYDIPLCKEIFHPFPKMANDNDLKQNTRRKLCRMDKCNAPAAKRTPYCAKHAGPRKCEFEGCSKCAQGRTRFCIAHGGGRRCVFAGCTKGARGKSFCAYHGGGKRCTITACTKLAVGSSPLCTAHGGGKRCKAPSCNKSAQSSFDFCVRHGGGRRCTVDGCSKVARGRSKLCMSHSSTFKKEGKGI
mmetsp:Transcript_51722/g.155236  ORF Transcript_51722/g.155236 Transcript_51722/m.155236 type:complete len:268 (+) Transcript_51722:728-1531(+)